MLRRAGISPGMRVLDIGCGVGDVSMIAAEIVGPTGKVLGIDNAEKALGTGAGARGARRLPLVDLRRRRYLRVRAR